MCLRAHGCVCVFVCVCLNVYDPILQGGALVHMSPNLISYMSASCTLMPLICSLVCYILCLHTGSYIQWISGCANTQLTDFLHAESLNMGLLLHSSPFPLSFSLSLSLSLALALALALSLMCTNVYKKRIVNNRR